jgi:GAF domain
MSEPDEPARPASVVRNREQELASTFVMLADSLAEDYDVVDLLDRLASACVRLLGVTAAGLLLDDQQGNLAVIASSSEETRLLEIFQVQNDQGPCLECLRTGAAVVSADLGADRPRWPLFAWSAGSSSNRRKASSRNGTHCPWRQRSTRCGSTPATRTSSSPTSPSPWSTIISTPGFPRAAWDGASRSAVRRRGLCYTHRSFVARTAAWTRFRTSSLRRISWMCVFTVFSLR